MLAERFHEGPQFSVEAFSENAEHQVVAVTRKFSDPEHFVELGHVVPAELAPGQVESVHHTVGALLDALGVASGATHTEVVLTKDGPRVIETHLRMGGDEIPVLVREATGVDLGDFLARQASGESVLPELRAALAAGRLRSAAIWFAAAPSQGVITEIRGLDEARRTAGVDEVVLLAEPGTVCEGLQSSDSRPASARAHGDTADEALDAARTALAALEFHVRTGMPVGETV